MLTWDELLEFARDALQHVAQQAGLTSPTFTCSSGSNVGDGFVSVMLRVLIQGYNTRNSVQQLRLIVKLPPLSKKRREEFEREVQIYNEYLPALEKLQAEIGLRRYEGFFNFPKCYYAQYDRESGETVIILEDLVERGFGLWDKFTPMDYFYSAKVLESLGRYHGLSLVRKTQKPELFAQFQAYNDVFFFLLEKESTQQMFQAYFDVGISAFTETEVAPREKLTHFRDNLLEEFAKLLSPTEAEPYAIVTHGDCWSKNFMFKKGIVSASDYL